MCLVLGVGELAYSQKKDEKDTSIPLDHFYVDRQGASMFRKILSKVTFGFSTGYGRTNFKHELDGLGILQNPDSLPKLFLVSNPTAGYSNWFNKSVPSGNTFQTDYFDVSPDTAKIGFKSKAFNIPFKAILHVEIKERYRIGGGYSMDFTHLGDFEALKYGDSIASFSPDANNFFLKKYFLMLGGNVYRYYEYLLVVDANIGGYSLGRQFDKSIIKKGIYFNFGVAVEREMSEYFRLFVRPSVELKTFKMNLTDGSIVKHKFNAFYINIGATYRFPELRRCFLKTCRAQMNHAHGNREYRSRVHPIYKKQNPHYGENHPTLLKYKGKNKKKLNPY